MAKAIETKSFFKVVRDKNSRHFGEKREDLTWSFEGLEVSDLAAIAASPEDAEKVIALVNAGIENFGKSLIAAPENKENWEFAPSAESCNLSTAYAALVADNRGKRKITKESLAAAGKFYYLYAQELLGKTIAQASAGEKVVAQKLVPIASDPAALSAMSGNLLALISAAADASADNIALAEALESNAETLEWLVSQCDSLASESAISADAL